MSTVGATRKPNKKLKIQDLTNQEISAVCDYKGQGYIRINQYLRTPKSERYKDKVLESKIDLISKSISKKKLSGKRVLYRGIPSIQEISDMKCLTEMLPDYEPGDRVIESPYELLNQIIVERGFMSTSKKEEVARNWAKNGVLLVIDSNDGDMKMDFEDVNFKKIKIKECDLPLREEGVLFDKGQKMQVDNVENGNELYGPEYIIKVSVIED